MTSQEILADLRRRKALRRARVDESRLLLAHLMNANHDARKMVQQMLAEIREHKGE